MARSQKIVPAYTLNLGEPTKALAIKITEHQDAEGGRSTHTAEGDGGAIFIPF